MGGGTSIDRSTRSTRAPRALGTPPAPSQRMAGSWRRSPSFRDRRAAGEALGRALGAYRGQDIIVLALPRGGVPVGFEVARALGAPLDVFIVRKIGVPGHEELAMG